MLKIIKYCFPWFSSAIVIVRELKRLLIENAIIIDTNLVQTYRR